MSPHLRRVVTLSVVGAGLVGVAACSRPVPMNAAPSATDAACATILVALPPVLGERQVRETTAQSTAAWTLPEKPVTNAFTYTCGVEPPAPSTDPCTTVGGVDWIVSEQGDRVWYTTYGRSPASRISIPSGHQDGTDVALAAISPAVARVPAERSCS